MCASKRAVPDRSFVKVGRRYAFQITREIDKGLRVHGRPPLEGKRKGEESGRFGSLRSERKCSSDVSSNLPLRKENGPFTPAFLLADRVDHL